MRLHEIIKNNFWFNIEQTFMKLYPDQHESIDAYERVFNQLKSLSYDADMSIEIRIEPFNEDGEGLFDVYGIDHGMKNELTNAVALEFTSWSRWLGMEINEYVISCFSETEIISHCLHEMTFIGFDESDIRLEFERIVSIYDEYKNANRMKNSKL